MRLFLMYIAVVLVLVACSRDTAPPFRGDGDKHPDGIGVGGESNVFLSDQTPRFEGGDICLNSDSIGVMMIYNDGLDGGGVAFYALDNGPSVSFGYSEVRNDSSLVAPMLHIDSRVVQLASARMEKVDSTGRMWVVAVGASSVKYQVVF